MSETTLRKLASIRKIDAIEPIDGADAIEVAVIGGWKVVTKRGEFSPGDLCVYFEIDSFLPTGNPAWQFLVDKSSREFEGVQGHRLRTVKLRGQVSQGLVLAINSFSHTVVLDEHEYEFADVVWVEGEDLTEILGIKKWEAPLPAELAGKAAGLFPSFIRKTDQERCQNLVPEIFQYEKTTVPTTLTLEQAAAGVEAGRLLVENGVVYTVHDAKADPTAKYEVTVKLDGSSATFFYRDGEVGVCSRNLQLKTDNENSENTFVKMLFDSGLNTVLPMLGVNLALQGELMGPAIQGNREGLKNFKFFLFDVQLIDEGRYMTPDERYELVAKLTELGVNPDKFDHVPVLHRAATLQELGITDVKQLLTYAEGPSLVHPVREGLVFKRLDGKFSFKAISNLFLLKEK